MKTMNQDTKNKFAAILSAQQAKVNEIKPNDKVVYKNAVIPAKVIEVDNNSYTPVAKIQFTDNGKIEQAAIEDLQKIKPSKMQSFTIIWQEGSGKHDGKIFNTWHTADKAMIAIYNEHSGLGYLKVKVCVSWENGKQITDRVDCSDNGGDFCPKRETIGNYLKRQKSVMYASNLQQGERIELSFEDEDILPTQELYTDEEKQTINDLGNTVECSNITVNDLLNESVKPVLKLVDYSVKSFAIIGETKSIKDQLRQLGGKFNYYLTCGPGWVFSKTKSYTVRKALNLI